MLTPLTLDDLVAGALLEQNTLSAVEQFDAEHDAGTIPDQARYYQRLLPANPPGPGEQYAFEVDMDACTGCKACVTACHNLNGLDDDEAWRKTGLLVGGDADAPYQQTVTSACHHCADPGCLNGCPVNAYEKDPDTGIVRHLDDQCIGCKYCTLTCPYEVPVYSKARGIVRKCDMCTQRLSVGEAPACVQACPNQAIRISVVKTPVSEPIVPGAPESSITKPTTRYTTTKSVPANTAPAAPTEPKEAHLPLVIMLVLTQLSVGTFLFLPGPQLALFALVVCALALVVSTLHLGRPQYAFRAILGIRHSWLSREIVAFGAFAKFAAAYTATLWIPLLDIPLLRQVCAAAMIASGLGGVFCSAMLYHVTGKASWRLPVSGGKFALSTLMLGSAAFGLWHMALIVGLGKLTCELRSLNPLMLGPLRTTTQLRFTLFALGLLLLPVTAWGALVLLVAGELCERYLFFRAGV